jgi:hypothetical protein
MRIQSKQFLLTCCRQWDSVLLSAFTRSCLYSGFLGASKRPTKHTVSFAFRRPLILLSFRSASCCKLAGTPASFSDWYRRAVVCAGGYCFSNTWLGRVGLLHGHHASHHDFHHSRNVGNYGSAFTDGLFGTMGAWLDADGEAGLWALKDRQERKRL